MMYMLQSAVILMLGALVGAKSVSTTLGTFAQTTVYSGNSAEVERVVTIDDSLPVNEYHTIAVSGFSERIIEETLRITGEADVEVLDVKLSSVQTPRQHFPEYKTHLAKLTEELDGQQKTIQHLDNDQQRCDTRLGSVAAFVADGFNRPSIPAATESGSATSVKPRLSIAEMGEILDFQSKEQLRCHEQQLTVQPQRDAANRRIEELTKSLAQLKSANEFREGGVYLPVSRNEKVLEFCVLLKKARPTLSFLVTYMATTATWSPEYDIRIESKAGVDGNDKALSTSNGAVKQYRMEIDYFANVRQSTGEHWTDTRLVLSTANLAFLNAAPESRQQGLKFHGTRGEDDHDYWTFNDGVVKEHYQFLNRKVAPQQKGNVKTHMHMRSAPDGATAPQFLNVAADSMQSAVSVRTGDLSASHKFEVQYPVSVSSADLVQRQLPVGSVASSQKHLILVDKVSVDARVFSYVVPSADTSAYRMGWGQYALTSDQSAAAGGGAAGKQLSPLLASTTARVFIQGDNTGSVRFEAVQPGETIRMNLGTDRNIQVSTRKVMPVFKGEEEDRSTWFVRDKRKFRVRTEERTTSVRSSYPASEQEAVLVIVSENLPSSTVVDEITVELLSASLKSLLQLDGQGNVRGEGSSDATEPSSNNAYLEAILKRETAAPASPASGAPAAPTAYYCKSSGNIYWAVWLRGGQSVSIPYKYKVTWPAEKNLESL